VVLAGQQAQVHAGEGAQLDDDVLLAWRCAVARLFLFSSLFVR
jgi:hypothetical protein